jgi:hypothetical protein
MQPVCVPASMPGLPLTTLVFGASLTFTLSNIRTARWLQHEQVGLLEFSCNMQGCSAHLLVRQPVCLPASMPGLSPTA